MNVILQLMHDFEDDQLTMIEETHVNVVTQAWCRHHMSEQHLEVPFWTAAETLYWLQED